jgi:hypothetical protein
VSLLTAGLAALLLAAPPAPAPSPPLEAEQLLAPLRAGERALFDGWLYPRPVHRRLTADLIAVDLIIAKLEEEAGAERARGDELKEELTAALALSVEADAHTARELLRAEDAEARLSRARLFWFSAGALSALPLWGEQLGVEISSPRLTSALLALALGSTAWLLGD